MAVLGKAPVAQWAFGALAVVVGYVALALLSTAVQELWLGGVSYVTSPANVLVLAGVFTPVAGLIAGFVTALIAREATAWAIAAIVFLVAAETVYLFVTGRVDGPFWFEFGAGATLAAAVVLGAWLCRRMFRRSRAPAQPDPRPRPVIR